MKCITIPPTPLPFGSQAAGALDLTGTVVNPEGGLPAGVSVVTGITGIGAVTNSVPHARIQHGLASSLHGDTVERRQIYDPVRGC
ncbi:MAG: hypothetical protein AB1744_09755 [Candidatus Zixiibacteriota bacterium]